MIDCINGKLTGDDSIFCKKGCFFAQVFSIATDIEIMINSKLIEMENME